MTNCLSWDGDSWLDMEDWLKDQFALQIPHEDCKEIMTVGDLYQAMKRHLVVSAENRKCATALAFYSLRQALTDLRTPLRLSPQSRLADVNLTRLRWALNCLGGGLDVPRASATPSERFCGKIAFVAAIACISTALIALSSSHPISLLWLLGFLALALGSMRILLRSLTRVPDNCITLGDLSRRIAARNYGRFLRRGAKKSDDALWDSLREGLAALSALTPEQIRRETVFFKSQLKARPVTDR